MNPRFLYIAVTALILVITAEWFLWPVQQPDSPEHHRPENQLKYRIPDTLDFRLPAISVYREITERPLFFRSRRSVDAFQANATDYSGSFPESIRLRAVVISGNEKHAFLHDSESGDAFESGIHDKILGWRVIDIRPDGVTLKRGRASLVVPLSSTPSSTHSDK